MENFQYYTPTKIIFGRRAEEQTGQLAAEQGCKKVLVHYGGGSVVRSGLLERIYRSLDAVGISYVSLGGWCQIPDFLSCMRVSGSPGKSRLISFWPWAAEAS